MPKATSIKTKPKPVSSSPPVLSPTKAPPKPTASRNTMMQILLAKVENSKTLDWFELSLSLNKGPHPPGASKIGGKKRKSCSEEGDGMSGTQLREVFQDVLLPALKRGVLPWEEEVEGSSISPTTPGCGKEEAADDSGHLEGGAAPDSKPKQNRAKPQETTGRHTKPQVAQREFAEDVEEDLPGDLVVDYEEEEPM